jgi:hypothetical protein
MSWNADYERWESTKRNWLRTTQFSWEKLTSQRGCHNCNSLINSSPFIFIFWIHHSMTIESMIPKDELERSEFGRKRPTARCIKKSVSCGCKEFIQFFCVDPHLLNSSSQISMMNECIKSLRSSRKELNSNGMFQSKYTMSTCAGCRFYRVHIHKWTKLHMHDQSTQMSICEAIYIQDWSSVHDENDWNWFHASPWDTVPSLNFENHGTFCTMCT